MFKPYKKVLTNILEKEVVITKKRVCVYKPFFNHMIFIQY